MITKSYNKIYFPLDDCGCCYRDSSLQNTKKRTGEKFCIAGSWLISISITETKYIESCCALC